MKAVILAGGLGKRLRKVVRDEPKSMAPVLGKPFLQYQIEQLKKYNIIEIVLCVGYLANQIKSYFEDGAKFGVNIRYAVEKELLGTGGALKNARNYLKNEAFLVLNGDSYSDIDFSGLIQFHRKKKGKGTLVLTKMNSPGRYGLVRIDKDKRITEFLEKPRKDTKFGGIISAGVYLFEPEVLNYILPGRKISLEREVFPHLLKKNIPFFGYLTSYYFIDIGTPQNYAQIQEDMKEMIR